jgi:predicted PurR-regulated permease PerM
MQAAALAIMLAVVVVTVPLTIGGTIAISQGVQYGQTIRTNVALVQRLVRDPDDEQAKAVLERRSRAWSWIGKTIAGFANPEPERPIDLETVPLEEDEPSAAPPPSQGGTGVPSGDDPARLSTEPDPLLGEGTARPLPAPGSRRVEGITDWVTATFEQNLQGIGRLLARYLVGTGAGALDMGARALMTIGYLFFATFLVLFFFFFFSTGYERVTTSFTNLIPTWKRQRTLNLLSQMDAVIAGFVRGRLIIMGILMVMFTVGFWLIGVPGALIIGPIAGILGVVPYLGLISIPTAMLLMWLQPVGYFEFQQMWWWILLAPVVTYFAIQLFEDYVLTPAIQGKTTQMDVPSILFAVLAGGILAGFYGILLAIPAAACIKIMLRETFWPRFEAWAEGRVKDFLPISKYDPTEATISAPTERKE